MIAIRCRIQDQHGPVADLRPERQDSRVVALGRRIPGHDRDVLRRGTGLGHGARPERHLAQDRGDALVGEAEADPDHRPAIDEPPQHPAQLALVGAPVLGRREHHGIGLVVVTVGKQHRSPGRCAATARNAGSPSRKPRPACGAGFPRSPRGCSPRGPGMPPPPPRSAGAPPRAPIARSAPTKADTRARRHRRRGTPMRHPRPGTRAVSRIPQRRSTWLNLRSRSKAAQRIPGWCGDFLSMGYGMRHGLSRARRWPPARCVPPIR